MKQGINKLLSSYERAIDIGKFPVVIWPDTISEKDINDMVLSGLNVQSVIDMQHVYSGLQAKIKTVLVGRKT
jgi:hypothetical protein